MNQTMPQRINIGLRATLLGMAANFVLVLIKGAAGIFGNSYALIADAAESCADIFSSLAVWLGLKVALKAPDHDHPYGHGKAEPLATMIVALFMFAVAGLIAIEGIHNIRTPHALPKPYTLIVLAGVVLLKEILFRHVHNKGVEINSTAVAADAWHHRSDALTSLAAFIGISIALIGGNGYESADDWAALFAAAIVAYNGTNFFRPALREIMDAAPSSALLFDLRATAMQVPGVRALDKSLIRKMGFSYFVDLHILVDGTLSVNDGHDIAHAVKAALMRHNPSIHDVLVHVEPFHTVD